MVLFVAHIFGVYAAVRIVNRSVLPGVIFCNYLWPSLVLLYSVVIAKLAVPRPALFGLGVATVIFALLLEFGLGGIRSAFDSQSVWGLVLALFAANAWGLYSAITRRFGEVSGGSGVIPLFHLMSAAIALIAFLLSGEPSGRWADILVSWPILAAGIANFIAYLCWDIGTRKGGIVTLSLLADFIPWLSLAATSLLLGVEIEERTILSAAILVGGALTARLGTMASRAGR
jgi:drug/metabolite transporter (DMT)-like permease